MYCAKGILEDGTPASNGSQAIAADFQTEQNSFAVDERTPLQRDRNGKPISEACGEHTSEQYTQERRVRQRRASWARDSKEPRKLKLKYPFSEKKL